MFLLKVAWKWDSSFLSIHPRQVQDLVQSVIDVMRNVSAGEKHLTYYIASGLAKMLERLKEPRSTNGGIEAVDGLMMAPPQLPQQDLMFESFDMYGLDFNDGWNEFGASFDFFPPSKSGNVNIGEMMDSNVK